MRVIIAGSRWIDDYELVKKHILRSEFEITEVVSGCCRGVDTLGEDFADEIGVPVKPFPFVKGAGKAGVPIRNQQMAEYADALILIWDGESKGSLDMLRKATKEKLMVYTNI